MSISFTLFSRDRPIISADQSDWLERKPVKAHDPDVETWTFGGMYVWIRPYVASEDDALHCDPPFYWADEIAWQTELEGRLSDDTYDDWVEWMEALREQSRGALDDPQHGGFTYVWFDPAELLAHARGLVAANDGLALWSWLAQVHDQGKGYNAREAYQLLAGVVLEALARPGIDRHDGLLAQLWNGRDRLTAEQHEALEALVAVTTSDVGEIATARFKVLHDRRQRTLAAMPLPTTPDEIAALFARAVDGRDDDARELLQRLRRDGDKDAFNGLITALTLEAARRGAPDARALAFVDYSDWEIDKWRDCPEAATAESRAAFNARGGLASHIARAWESVDAQRADWKRRADEQARIQRERAGPPPETLAAMPRDVQALVREGKLESAYSRYYGAYGDRVPSERIRELIQAAWEEAQSR